MELKSLTTPSSRDGVYTTLDENSSTEETFESLDISDIHERQRSKIVQSSKKRRWIRIALGGLGVILALIGITVLVMEFEKKKDAPEQNFSHTWDSPRLPPFYFPSHYDLSVTTDMQNFSYQMTQNIVVMVNRSHNQANQIDFYPSTIVMHAFGLNITEVKAHRGNGETAAAYSVTYNETLQFVFIEVKEIVKWVESGDDKFNISFSFQRNLRDDMRGFYKSSYAENGTTHWLATTDFEPDAARYAYVCFDEPALKATFKLKVTTAAGYGALSNMPQSANRTLADGKMEYEFEKSVKMSTYLVCFIVSKFASMETTTGNVTVRVWTTPGTVHQVGFALDVAKTVLEKFQTFYAINYPLPKLDLIAIPDYGAGAMENWGLITFRQAYLLYEENSNYDELSKQNVAAVIAHELAHQWFGNLVTMKWWSELWLNEGFATFMEYLGTDLAFPDWEMWPQFVVDKQRALDLDSLRSSHPLEISSGLTADELMQQFDAISYSKGGSVIRMLQSYLNSKGGNFFTAGLTSYLNEHAYANAQSSDLWKSFADVSGDRILPELMNTWTLQTGYPLVEVTTNATYATLTQRRFILGDNSPSNETWYVPVIASTSTSGRNEDVSIQKGSSSSFQYQASTDGYLMLDKDGTGFFRVLYHHENYQKLADQLLQDHEVLPVAFRCSLLDDAFNLATAGRLNISEALHLGEYLKNERDFTVWITAIKSLNNINDLLQLELSSGDFSGWYLSLLSNVATEHLAQGNNGTHTEQLLRPVILLTAAKNGHEESIHYAVQQFSALMSGVDNIPVNLREFVYDIGIQQGGEKEFNFILDRYMKSTDISERLRCLSSLGRTTEHYLLKKLLDMSIDLNIVRMQDITLPFSRVASNVHGQDIAWTFLKQNWELLETRYEEAFSFLGDIITTASSHFSTAEKLEDVKNWFSTITTTGISRSEEIAIERITSNIEWLQKNGGDLRNYLNSLPDHSS
eukprot:TRINITY_DN1694_c0_g2_i1.p1 TRINITY_DN1694_c0_g2~~TRINITY_DN1694_c0_g2_i1.p1  ORF type:complete len:972 (+),score=281.68 TRINITY_DN1694_c0_g2_i1:412-3327(+)